MSGVYFNEIDAFCCEWLGNLFPGSRIDQRSIHDVRAADLVGLRRCHFFAGVAGWELALQLAGWPDYWPVWTGSCPCFPAGTIVITSVGYKSIEDIQVGDLVLTHRGRFCPVLQTGSEMAECVLVRGQGHHGLVCTPDHPFLVGEEQWADARDLKGQRWATVAEVPSMPMPELVCPRSGCFFDRNARKFRAKGERGGKPVYIGVYDTLEEAVAARHQAVLDGRVAVKGADAVDVTTPGFARFLGYWVGDGWVSGSMVLLCGSRDDRELLDGIFADAGLPGRAYLERTSSRIRCGSRHLVAWLKEHFGQYAHGKRIPVWLHGMAPEYRKAFLDGYLLADGHREVQSRGGGEVTCFTTASKSLAIGVRILLNQAGLSASIRVTRRGRDAVIEGRTVTELPSYRVTAYATARSFRFSGRHGWGIVRSVEPAGFHRVYNVAVAEDESYTADGIVVHNCPPFSAAGKKQRCPTCGGRPLPCPRRTGYFICIDCEHAWLADERHLWPEFWRLIRDCRPPVVFGEQVAGADGLLWLAGVRASLERIGYAVGASDLPAGGIGAPHRRQRLFWVAIAEGRRALPGGRISDCVHGGWRETAVVSLQPRRGEDGEREWQNLRHDSGNSHDGSAVGQADSNGGGRCQRQERHGEPGAGERTPQGNDTGGCGGTGSCGDGQAVTTDARLPWCEDRGADCHHAGEQSGRGEQPERGGSTGHAVDALDVPGVFDHLQGLEGLRERVPDLSSRTGNHGVGPTAVAFGLCQPEGNGRDEGRSEPDGRNTGTGCVPDERLGEPSRSGQSLPERGELPGEERQHQGRTVEQSGCSSRAARGLDDTGGVGAGCEQSCPSEPGSDGEDDRVPGSSGGRPSTAVWVGHPDSSGRRQVGSQQPGRHQAPTPWDDYLLIPCRDGKVRRISSQPGDEPLAASVPRDVGPLLAWLERMGVDPVVARRAVRRARRNRVGRLRAYGNAIVPHLAAEFIRTVMEYLHLHQ